MCSLNQCLCKVNWSCFVTSHSNFLSSVNMINTIIFQQKVLAEDRYFYMSISHLYQLKYYQQGDILQMILQLLMCSVEMQPIKFCTEVFPYTSLIFSFVWSYVITSSCFSFTICSFFLSPLGFAITVGSDFGQG